MLFISRRNSYKLANKVDSTVPPNRWVASLSNGETIYENVIPDERPAWERLSEYCLENKLSITNLRLQIAGTEVKLPPGQEGYLQKKVAWTVGGHTSGLKRCIGYVQGDRALIYEVGEDKSSETKRTVNPGEPFVIYKYEKRTHATSEQK